MRSAVAEWGKRADMVVHNDDPFNCEPPPAALAGNEITETPAFYCRNHGHIPAIAPEDWRLTITTDGSEPRTLTYHDLTTFRSRDVIATLQCAGNRRRELLQVRPMPGKEPWAQCAISTAVWHGASLSDVLAAAGIHRSEGHVAFTGPDLATQVHQVFGASIPLATALSGDTLLAWEMNGEPLPRVHGGPVRVVVPGFIGARSVKWLTGVSVQTDPSANHFQAVDYRLHGEALSTLPLNCAILTPDDGAGVPAGKLTIHGYAIGADCERITRVEVSLDDGHNWQEATLSAPRNRWTWRFWTLDTVVAEGPLGITARAVDDTGASHPESPATLWNPGGYANNAWARATVRVQATQPV
ncbi:sulfite oxidase [Mycobacterium sp. M1]|uniref:Sulfite oxidase n=1 Tax=Mycolicibacter acidiphilus TaxID=2835306 RepID=A0ABS5RE05_9MYCO|nr:sulfite oxidase [Mycolicibacter acidiphilus]MBS9532516.1 sulfite oxidase [Mycolicibacter acidiphilus]